MFIDAYAEDWIAQLEERSRSLDQAAGIFLLIEGAFIPRVHRSEHSDNMALLRGCERCPMLGPIQSAEALADDELPPWRDWLWQQPEMHELPAISAMLQQWREER